MELLDGKELSGKILAGLKESILEAGIKPELLIILCGENPESIIYTKLKAQKGRELGIIVDINQLPETATEKDIIDIIGKSRADGIIVQLPLPKHINAEKVLSSIPLEKDVDGLTLKSRFIPATPKGIMRLLKEYNMPIRSKEIVIINDSNIVGRPLAMLLLDEGATVTICNKSTQNTSEHAKKADLLITGVGIPNFITKDMIKEGAIVIDVGISKVGNNVFGDVNFDEVKEKAAYITPVPGGVGPMTIAMLLENVIEACNQKNGN